MTAKRPPPVPSQLSQYDGHDDYHARFSRPPLSERFKRVFEVVAVLGVWLATGHLFFRWFRPGHGEPNADVWRVLIWLFAYVVVGLVIAGFYGYRLYRMKSDYARWQTWIACGLIFFVIFWVLPVVF